LELDSELLLATDAAGNIESTFKSVYFGIEDNPSFGKSYVLSTATAQKSVALMQG